MKTEIAPRHPKIKEISAKLDAQADGDLMEYARLVNLYAGGYRYSGGNRQYTLARIGSALGD